MVFTSSSSLCCWSYPLRLLAIVVEIDSLFLGDNTFTDVVRDFSNIASLNPERLQRKYDPDRHTNV